jgi:flagellar hook-length control protein FliK
MATLAAPPGETVPPGTQLAATEMPLLTMRPGTAVPTGVVEDIAAQDIANDKLDDTDPAVESAGDAPLPLRTPTDQANPGLLPTAMREMNAFVPQVIAERSLAPEAQLPSQPEVQTAAVATADALTNANAHNRTEAALTIAASKPLVAGAEAGAMLRPDVAFSHYSPTEKGGDAPSREPDDLIGLSLPDLAVRDGTPRSLVPDSRDSGALTPNRPGFADALGQRIAWFARSDGGNARLELDPPHLGPLEVSVRVDKGEASVVFVASQASVRDAVSQAIPELRTLFAQSGLSLGDVNVSAGGAGHQAFASPYNSPFGHQTDPSAEGLPLIPTASMRQGLVDLYA